MAELELSPAVFSILGALIEEKVGLHYGLLDREILQEKAAGRAVEAGFDTFLDYYYFLRYDPHSAAELKALTETLVVNETYFFREWPAIDVLVNSFIAPRCRSGDKLRIWSAACATGEEPLSLAMQLDQLNLLDRVTIVASDISARALAKAQSGRFGRRSIRHVPVPELQACYVKPEADGYSVPQKLISAIDWQQRNLMLEADFKALGQFDIILCRNVLIYFADSTVKSVLDQMAQALKPAGILAVGVSESLLRYGSAFVGEEHRGAFVYRLATK